MKENIDVDTLREILKIFINLVLWRKIRRDMINIACYVCDIGLMIDNSEINMLSVLCLSQLSENENSHKHFFNTVNPAPENESADIEEEILITDKRSCVA